MSKNKNNTNSPRDNLPRSRRLCIRGYPREHYNEDKTEKMCYKSADTATSAARHMTAMHGELIEAYQCQYCGCWHIGHRRARPQDETLMVLNTTFHNLSSMINRYRDDINQIAQQILSVSEKLDRLETCLWDRYHDLKENGFLLDEPENTITPKQQQQQL